ncbi:hypothetical protein [Enterobacter sp.]|uniref:hypothetical protein n=1 Tax=Enterobacter sp. TaxID=42895 RepID=UPI002980AF0C|nr:hypothetical protein [Enterobacter sp.]
MCFRPAARRANPGTVGGGDDTINGGEGADYLEGGAGDDVLNGGSRDAIDDGVTNRLYGGKGFNRYLLDGHDIIFLMSKTEINGAVFLTKNDEERELKEAIHYESDPAVEYKDSNNNKYVFDGDVLVISDEFRT